MADASRFPEGLIIEGSLLVARPISTLVRDSTNGQLYASTNAAAPAYVLIGGGTSGGGAVTETAADPYNVTTTDHWVLLTGTGQTVNLPAGATHTGGVVVLKDKNGTAFASPITVNANGGETIDGVGNLSLDSNYVSVTLVSSGTEWSIT